MEWTWLRPAGDVTVTPLSASPLSASLAVPVHPGHLWSAATNTARNVGRLAAAGLPRERPSELTASLTLPMDEESPFGLQAGLLLMVDENNYLKLVKEWLKGKPHVVVAVEKDGEARVLFKKALEADGAAESPALAALDLQLAVHGDGHVAARFRQKDVTRGEWETLFDSVTTTSGGGKAEEEEEKTDVVSLRWLTEEGDFGVLANGAAEDKLPLPVANYTLTLHS